MAFLGKRTRYSQDTLSASSQHLDVTNEATEPNKGNKWRGIHAMVVATYLLQRAAAQPVVWMYSGHHLPARLTVIASLFTAPLDTGCHKVHPTPNANGSL